MEMSAINPKKILPFQTWRPLTLEEAARVPPGLRFVRVSRVPRRTTKGSKASQPEAERPSSDGVVSDPIAQGAADGKPNDET